MGKATLANKAKIDEIDAKMLKMLLLESRTSFTDIAAARAITVTAVRMRYKRLWKDGVIKAKMLSNPHCWGTNTSLIYALRMPLKMIEK
jgi:DNA-binding Lrp family transcriptional regulator